MPGGPDFTGTLGKDGHSWAWFQHGTLLVVLAWRATSMRGSVFGNLCQLWECVLDEVCLSPASSKLPHPSRNPALSSSCPLPTQRLCHRLSALVPRVRTGRLDSSSPSSSDSSSSTPPPRLLLLLLDSSSSSPIPSPRLLFPPSSYSFYPMLAIKPLCHQTSLP